MSSTSSRDSPDDVIDRCFTLTGDVMPQLGSPHDSRVDTVPTLHSGTVPPTLLLTGGTVPEALDYRSVLVGAALARQQMMTSLSHCRDHSNNNNYQHYRRHGRRFTPYVITNDFISTRFRPA